MAVSEIQSPAPPVGVIESLAAGFETVAERLPLLLLPLLLDLFLWVGPRVSSRPAYEAFYADVVVPLMELQPTDVQEQFAQEYDQIDVFLNEIEPRYLPVVNWPMGDVLFLGVPSLIVRQAVRPLPFGFEPPLLELQSVLNALCLALLLPIGWSVAGVFYRGLVAFEVRDQRVGLVDLLRRMPVYWVNAIGFMVLVALLALVVMMPFVAVGMVLSTFALGLANLSITAGLFVVIWLGVFSSFTAHSVLLNDKWVLQALWDSIRVVQTNLSATTLLWMLVFGLNMGLGFLFSWAGLTTDVWFIVLAIGVHAFVNTALIAATYVFFKDRYRYWRELRAVLLAHWEKLNKQQSSAMNGGAPS